MPSNLLKQLRIRNVLKTPGNSIEVSSVFSLCTDGRLYTGYSVLRVWKN